jgi:hypothetical protein
MGTFLLFWLSVVYLTRKTPVREKPKGHIDPTYLDEVYAKAAARRDKLEHLGKKKRQQYRGVDAYRCMGCGEVGAPWSWLPATGVDLDEVEEDIIHNVCPCGGVIVLIDD